MTAPFLCAKCGTIYSPESVGEVSPMVAPSNCAVCGGSLTRRVSAQDPAPSTKNDKWFWLFAFFGLEVFFWVVLAVVAIAALIKGS